MPRPILKALPLPSPTITATSPLPFAASSHVDSPHVHFPPTPTMTQTETTHSPFSYDRKPIVVQANVCALPERGGRKLELQASPDRERADWFASCRREKVVKGGYFHPRACEAFEYEGQLDPSSLLFEHDAALQLPPSQPYPTPYPHHFRPSQALQIQAQHRDRDHDRLSKHVPPPLVFDSSESDSSDMGSPPTCLANDPPSHPYHYAGSRQSMDLTLPFLTPKENVGLHPSLKKYSPTRGRIAGKEDSGRQRTRTGSTSGLNRTRKVVSASTNTVCGGFSAGFCEPGLEDCLGGF